VTFVGQHYHVRGHQLQPLPVQRPHPPLLIGGNRPRLLTLAAQEADIVGLTGITFRRGGTGPELSGWTVAGLEARLQHIRAAAGTRYELLELHALVQRVEVTDHRYIAAEELAHRWPQLSPAELLQSPYVLVGTVEQIVEDLQRRWERWGFSSYMLFERDMETFAPVVARLTGH
jgi:alkanesulfonate monooxygenase SsuD/methylene tetrahydromethanopterin reductase-like flavin-dependent oxidoreductase (luciferase family)